MLPYVCLKYIHNKMYLDATFYLNLLTTNVD